MSDTEARSVHLRRALDILRWSRADLACECGVSLSTARRWTNGEYRFPDELLIWIGQLVAFHEAHPAPKDPRKEST